MDPWLIFKFKQCVCLNLKVLMDMICITSSINRMKKGICKVLVTFMLVSVSRSYC